MPKITAKYYNDTDTDGQKYSKQKIGERMAKDGKNKTNKVSIKSAANTVKKYKNERQRIMDEMFGD